MRKDQVGAHHRIPPGSERSAETALGGGRVDCLGELDVAAHPVAVAPDVDHVGAVEQPVQQRGGHDLVVQDLSPLLEALCSR